MVQDFPDQLLLIGKGGDDIIAINPEGAGRPGNIVQIKIGDRRTDDLVIAIADRIMDQGKINPGPLSFLVLDGNTSMAAGFSRSDCPCR
jgi:hypothetical protein